MRWHPNVLLATHAQLPTPAAVQARHTESPLRFSHPSADSANQLLWFGVSLEALLAWLSGKPGKPQKQAWKTTREAGEKSCSPHASACSGLRFRLLNGVPRALPDPPPACLAAPSLTALSPLSSEFPKPACHLSHPSLCKFCALGLRMIPLASSTFLPLLFTESHSSCWIQ